MSRSLSSAALQAIFAQETGEAVFFLVTIDHSTWGTPVRMVNNNENIVSGGNTYYAFPVDIQLPNDTAEQMPRTKLKVCNVDREIIAALRALSTKPTVTLSIIFSSTPNTIEAGPFNMRLENYSYDAETVTGDLILEDILNEPFPQGTFNPGEYPGLFG